MSIRRRILAFTSCRSDYDLLSLLYRRLNDDPAFEFGLIVSGTHHSPRFGSTVESVRDDGLPILAEIETLIDSDSKSARAQSMALLIQAALPAINRFKPDVILLVGDREEVLAAATLAAYLRIPSVHFFGGDHASDGNVDNASRHAISKLSTFHFAAHESHAARLRAIGESTDRIFIVGSPSLDKFLETEYWDRLEVLRYLGTETDRYAVLLYHPMPGDEARSSRELAACFDAAIEKNISLAVGISNCDPGAQALRDVREKYRHYSRFRFAEHWPRIAFVNLLRHAEFLMGNSSAGLYEAPLLRLPVINVGRRQAGRLAAENIIFVDGDQASIESAVDRLRGTSFQTALMNLKSPYGDGKSTVRCHDLLRRLDLLGKLEKKEDPLYG